MCVDPANVGSPDHVGITHCPDRMLIWCGKTDMIATVINISQLHERALWESGTHMAGVVSEEGLSSTLIGTSNQQRKVVHMAKLSNILKPLLPEYTFFDLDFRLPKL